MSIKRESKQTDPFYDKLETFIEDCMFAAPSKTILIEWAAKYPDKYGILLRNLYGARATREPGTGPVDVKDLSDSQLEDVLFSLAEAMGFDITQRTSADVEH